MLLRTPIRAVALLLGAGAPAWCAAQYVPPAQIQINTPQPFGYSGRPGTAGQQMQTPPAPMALPPTATTSTPAPAPPSPAPVAPQAPRAGPAYAAPVTLVKTPAHRAKVLYADGRLTIDAENSSLNQILHEISMQSGIRISGGVADERVFGLYGPDTPERILVTLLDGTGSNMLFLASRGSFPGELVLTPRTGGPTPPNPNAAAMHEPDEETIDRPPDASRGPDLGAQPAVPRPQAPAAIQPGAAAVPADAAATPAAPAADSTTEQSPNGVKTPQQIYDQLIQLQKQQQQTTTPP